MATNPQRENGVSHSITPYIDQFSDLKIAVVGDIMLDRYVRGDTSRISPEAPVPVISYESEQSMLGGAGNVAQNLVVLGVQVSLFGSVGHDERGEKVLSIADTLGIDTAGVVSTASMPTTYKERIVSRGQHVVRIDHELKARTDTYTLASLNTLINHIDSYDAVVISDYLKGVLSDGVIQAILEATKKHGVPLIVDTKPSRMYMYKGATLITPNDKEAIEATGMQDPLAAARKLSADLSCAVLLTLGPKGACLISEGDETAFSTRVKEVVDVSGAGDTVSAVASAMIAAGSSFKEATYLSNLAGGIVVCKQGTAFVTRSELVDALSKRLPSSYKIHTIDSLRERVETERADGNKIVLTNGCFDILHRGHIEYLEEARRQGDFLIVATNADESVSRLKGPTRPINALENRMAVLAALSSVDAVISFSEDTATKLIEILKPDVWVKGGDYTIDQLRKFEGAAVEAYGGTIFVTPMVEDHSTTRIIQKVVGTHIETHTTTNKK